MNLSDRPIRAAAATAQAISEAQQHFLDIEPPPEYKCNKHGKIEILADKPVKTRKYCKKPKLVTTDSNEDTTMSQSTNNDNNICEEIIERDVDTLMSIYRKQFLEMVETMQDENFIENISKQLHHEKKRRNKLIKKSDQLNGQIQIILKESTNMLKSYLLELGMDVREPSEFILNAQKLIEKHHDLQHRKHCLESEVSKLEEEQRLLINENHQLIRNISYTDAIIGHKRPFDNATLTRVEDDNNNSINNNSILNNSSNNYSAAMSSETRLAMIIEESVRDNTGGESMNQMSDDKYKPASSKYKETTSSPPRGRHFKKKYFDQEYRKKCNKQ